jgi:hypothetical protein
VPAAAERRGRTSLRPASGDGSWRAGKIGVVLVLEGRGASPAWLAEWSRKHPSGAAGVRAAAMTMCPGAGLLSQMIERGRWPAHAEGASLPGAW